MSQLDMPHLQLLVALRRQGSVTAAARQLGLTQSAVSHRVKEIERRVGRPLFERANRKLRFTVAGERLLASAETILAELARAEADLAADTPSQNLVRVGSYAYSCYRWLPAFLADYQKARPETDFEIVATVTADPVTALANAEMDLGIVAGTAPSPLLNAVRLFEDELVAVLPAGHVLCAKPRLEAKDFLTAPFVTYSAVPERGFEDELLFRPARVRPPKMIRAGLTEAVVELVRAGFGLSILSRWAVEPYVKDGGVEIRPLTQKGLTVSWYAITRKGSAAREPALGVAKALGPWCRVTMQRPAHRKTW